jgi:hypothetical protein
MPHVVVAAWGAPRALICKPDLALKPEELTSDMSPVVFACRLDLFEAYYDARNMQVKDIAVQKSYFKACIHPSLNGRIELLIVKGQTPILGRIGACSILKNEFLVEHPLFSRRQDFFRFKQGYGQSMSDAMAELQKLGYQATLGALDATDLYIMHYLTMNDDPKLLEKMLEKELPIRNRKSADEQLITHFLGTLETAFSPASDTDAHLKRTHQYPLHRETLPLQNQTGFKHKERNKRRRKKKKEDVNQSFTRLRRGQCAHQGLIAVAVIAVAVAGGRGTPGTPHMPGAIREGVPTTMPITHSTEGVIQRWLDPMAMLCLQRKWDNGGWVA